MSRHREERLANGLILLVEELPRPAVAAQLVIPGGSANDPAGGEGTATLLARLLQRGAGDLNTRQLAEAFDDLGYRHGVSAAQAHATLSITGLAEAWDEAFGLLADIVRRPRLPEAEFEACRQLAVQALRGLDDEPAQKLQVEIVRRYFPGAFGRNRLGSMESLAALDHDGVIAHYEAAYRPDGAILAVAGGVPFEQVKAAVEARFGDWTGAPPAVPAADPSGRPEYEHVPQETEQVQLGIVYEDIPPGTPARYHAQMAAQVLSGGMGSRLFTEVREKRGLCYAVHARSHTVPGQAYMAATAGTTTERSSETLQVMAEQLLGLPGTVTDEEVQRGRVRLLSSLIMGDESTSSRAARMAMDMHLLGRVREIDEMRAGIEAVTAASLNEHLEAHPPADFTVLTLGTSFEWPAGLEL